MRQPSADLRVPAGERQLFLDDYGVAEIADLSRTMHQPTKKGAVIRPAVPGEQSVLLLSSPIWSREDERYKVWLLSGAGQAESVDGIAWTRMVNPAAEWPESEIHNVVYDPFDPDPSRRYKGTVYKGGEGLLPIVSDGVSWRALGAPPIPAGDTNMLHLDLKERNFIATVRQKARWGRAIGLSTSTDFEHWTDPELILEPDDLDQEKGRETIAARLDDPTLQQPLHQDPSAYNVDIYDMPVFRYEGLYIGVPLVYHATGPLPNYPNTEGFNHIQLTCSRDLKSWRRLGDREPFIGPSRLGSGAYDLTQLGPTAPILRAGEGSFSGADELWFYYNGTKYRGGWKYVGTYPDGEHMPLPGLEPDHGAICLAVLRRDGFISLDAQGGDGFLLTQPFAAPEGNLHLNADALEGYVGVQVCDEEGAPMPGFEASQEIEGDHLDATAGWPGGQLQALADRRIRLRITLHEAQLYAYWIE